MKNQKITRAQLWRLLDEAYLGQDALQKELKRLRDRHSDLTEAYKGVDAHWCNHIARVREQHKGDMTAYMLTADSQSYKRWVRICVVFCSAFATYCWWLTLPPSSPVLPVLGYLGAVTLAVMTTRVGVLLLKNKGR